MCTHIPTYIFAFLKNLPAAASSLPHIYIFLVNGNPMGLCSVCSRAGSSLLFVEVFVTKILLIHCEKIVDFCYVTTDQKSVLLWLLHVCVLSIKP